MSEEINNSIEHIAKCEMYDVIEVNFLKKKFDDLQQKVEQLEKENILLKEANNYHQEVIKSMKEPENAHHYHLENIKLRAINNQLENIRKEAIEYIKNTDFDSEDNIVAKKVKDGIIGAFILENKIPNDLLNILNKGSDK